MSMMLCARNNASSSGIRQLLTVEIAMIIVVVLIKISKYGEDTRMENICAIVRVYDLLYQITQNQGFSFDMIVLR
jgi:hypothetical protein